MAYLDPNASDWIDELIRGTAQRAAERMGVAPRSSTIEPGAYRPDLIDPPPGDPLMGEEDPRRRTASSAAPLASRPRLRPRRSPTSPLARSTTSARTGSSCASPTRGPSR